MGVRASDIDTEGIDSDGEESCWLLAFWEPPVTAKTSNLSMRASILSNTVILLQSTALTFAIPLSLPLSASSSLTTRVQAANTEIISDAVPEANSSPSPRPRPIPPLLTRRATPGMTWYAPNSAVHVILTPITIIAGAGVEHLLEGAANAVMDEIAIFGDGLIAGGWFQFTGEDNLWVTVHNSNNHQTSWSVLARALAAVSDYMRWHDWGSTSFGVYDGAHLVGEGQIG